MRRSRIILSACSTIIVLLCTLGFVAAEELNINASKVLAVVPVKGGAIDQSVYRQFDRLVPELRKISKSRIVKLECRYSGRPDRERDVENAYKLAGRIEKYFRDHHKLELDLWVSVDIAPKTNKSAPVLTLAVFSDDIKKLDAVPVDTQKKDQQ